MSDILETTPSAPATVVVIDDDPSVRALLEVSLELDGFTVRTAADGRRGLDLVEQTRPACVLLDVMMPELDGHSVLRMLRERYGLNLPVIMLTAASDDSHAWQAWSAGVDCFIAKPFDLDALLRQVSTLTLGHGAQFDGCAA